MTQTSAGNGLFAILGASQLLGLALTIGGAFVYATGGRPRTPTLPNDRFTISAAPTPGGAQLALRLTL